MRWLRVFQATALLALGIALGACGGSSDGGETATLTSSAATTSTGPTTTAAPVTTVPATTAPATTEPTVTTPQPTTVAIRVVGGKPQGGIARPSVEQGERVVLVVRSDVAEEVHLHGYDLSQDVVAGGTVRIAFVANVRGRFELELENSGVQIAELTVR